MNKKGTGKHLEKVRGCLELFFIICYMPNFSDGTMLLNNKTYLFSICKNSLANNISNQKTFLLKRCHNKFIYYGIVIFTNKKEAGKNKQANKLYSSKY